MMNETTEAYDIFNGFYLYPFINGQNWSLYITLKNILELSKKKWFANLLQNSDRNMWASPSECQVFVFVHGWQTSQTNDKQ